MCHSEVGTGKIAVEDSAAVALRWRIGRGELCRYEASILPKERRGSDNVESISRFNPCSGSCLLLIMLMRILGHALA